MAKAKVKGWSLNEGFTEEEKKENDRKVHELERKGMVRLKERLETSPEAKSLREVDGFAVEMDERGNPSLRIAIKGYETAVWVGFRYTAGTWALSRRECTGLRVSSRLSLSSASFGRHYGYDFEENVVPASTFKKMVDGMRGYLKDVLVCEGRERAAKRMNQVAMDECHKVLEKAGYKVSPGTGLYLNVSFKKEFLEKFSAPYQPEAVVFRGDGKGNLTLMGARYSSPLVLFGQSFQAKVETIVQVMGAIENFYVTVERLGGVRG